MKVAAAIAIGIVGASFVAGSAAVFVPRGVAHQDAARHQAEQPLAPVWSEEKWPFLLDQWGVGKAFVCSPEDCGVKIEVYIRPKIGFCNCSTGVSDDAELERVADTELLSRDFKPLGPSRPVKVGWMRGLSRPYLVSAENQVPGKSLPTRVVSIAFNDECDVVVALATLGDGNPETVAPAVIAFLNTKPMVLWAKKEMGLEFVRRDW